MSCGIYKITNIENNKIYVGSSKNLEYRWTKHQQDLRAGRHINRHLQSAWNKYGCNVFIHQVIEECSIEDLANREQFWMNKLNPEYNILKFARSAKGTKLSDEAKKAISDRMKGNKWNIGRHLTEEVKKKISEKAIGNTRGLGNKSRTGYKATKEQIEFISNLHKGNKYNLGRKASDETKKKLSIVRLGNKNALGYRHTEETKQKLRDAHKRRKNMKNETACGCGEIVEIELKEDIEDETI